MVDFNKISEMFHFLGFTLKTLLRCPAYVNLTVFSPTPLTCLIEIKISSVCLITIFRNIFVEIVKLYLHRKNNRAFLKCLENSI